MVADSVTESAASEPQIGSLLSWITMTRPGSDLIGREVASAPLPFGSVMSVTLCRCGRGREQLRGRDRVEQAVVASTGIAVDRNAGEDAAVGAGDDDVAARGDAPGRNQVGQQRSAGARWLSARSCRDRGEAVDALGEQIGERGEVALGRPARFWRVWSSTCTKAPRQIVIRKAMISVGTARRSAGSAVSSR